MTRALIMFASCAIAILGMSAPARALEGGAPVPGLTVAQLDVRGAPACTATVVAVGWALSAAHCLDDQPRTLRTAAGTRHVIGQTFRAPDEQDLALLAVPDVTAPTTVPLAPGPPPCSREPRPASVWSFAHHHEQPSRQTVTAALQLYDECDPAQYNSMVLNPEGAPPVRVCGGDSGSPVVSRDAQGAWQLEGVVVSRMDPTTSTSPASSCGAERYAIGFAETVRTAPVRAWLGRINTPAPALRPFLVRPYASTRYTWLAIPSRPGAPGAGFRVQVRQGARVVARGRISRAGTVRVPRLTPGRYRLQLSGTHLRSRPFRITPTMTPVTIIPQGEPLVITLG